MTVVRFEAADPVGVNELYQPGLAFAAGGRRRPVIRKSGAGLMFAHRLLVAARACWRRLGVSQALGGNEKKRVPVSVTMWLAFETHASDIDGPIKPTLDSLQKAGVVWNDNRVDELHVYRLPPDRARPRVVVEAHEIVENG